MTTLAFVIVQGAKPHRRSKVLVVNRPPYYGAPFIECDDDPTGNPEALRALSKRFMDMVNELSVTSVDWGQEVVIEIGRKIEPWGDPPIQTLCIFYELSRAILVYAQPKKGGFQFDSSNPNGLMPDFTLDFAKRDWYHELSNRHLRMPPSMVVESTVAV